jgi:5-methyltetrahydropteroyltriglutamate--homocysteine methyltransferase
MALSATLGYPRFGAQRELKRALERYWSGKIDAPAFETACREIRRAHWQLQQSAGIDIIPSNDFSPYDHVLDLTALVGAVPERYGSVAETVSWETYFAMARGRQTEDSDLAAMEMTKWFDTNYHYIVPEIRPGQTFRITSTKVFDEFQEALDLGIRTRPVLLGPVTYLLLSKPTEAGYNPIDALPDLLPVYGQILQRLAELGADWVQIDEPALALDLDAAAQRAFQNAYAQLGAMADPKLLLATYFGGLEENLSLAANLPVAGLHVDLVRAPQQLTALLAALPPEKTLSLGVIDGRNVWRADLDAALTLLQQAEAFSGERLQVAPSCSLMFTPHDLALEADLDVELRSWLAFARQKVDELALLTRALNEGKPQVEAAFARAKAAVESRKAAQRTHNPTVRARAASVTPAMLHRSAPYTLRQPRQADRLALPPLPTTTIGSFPQTEKVRAMRKAFEQGGLAKGEYEIFLKSEIEHTIRLQEEIGLDVLVHGEYERTDMVEYFGEQLTGFAFTRHGWVQSYGSRGVRSPILYGDVQRPAPMTVNWSVFAQSLTPQPVKGMLTGPVTILEWSFVRDDQPRAETCRQIALALRDEVLDLEKAGIRIIQIDEPAFREGLPLRRKDHAAYLAWAVDCFRLASSGVRDETQIHTHMCYAEFNDILAAIGRMDADVISIEASRSKMELLDAFRREQYPNEIGPGVYDIHSPRVPTLDEMEDLIERAAEVLPVERLWVNPDCGLKTRRWEEVEPALYNLVGAARQARLTLEKSQKPAV